MLAGGRECDGMPPLVHWGDADSMLLLAIFQFRLQIWKLPGLEKKHRLLRALAGPVLSAMTPGSPVAPSQIPRNFFSDTAPPLVSPQICCVTRCLVVVFR